MICFVDADISDTIVSNMILVKSQSSCALVPRYLYCSAVVFATDGIYVGIRIHGIAAEY